MDAKIAVGTMLEITVGSMITTYMEGKCLMDGADDEALIGHLLPWERQILYDNIPPEMKKKAELAV